MCFWHAVAFLEAQSYFEYIALSIEQSSRDCLDKLSFSFIKQSKKMTTSTTSIYTMLIFLYYCFHLFNETHQNKLLIKVWEIKVASEIKQMIQNRSVNWLNCSPLSCSPATICGFNAFSRSFKWFQHRYHWSSWRPSTFWGEVVKPCDVFLCIS